jgi:integrase
VFEVKWRKGVAYLHATIGGKRIRKSLGTRDKEIARRRAAEEAGRLERVELYGVEKEATFADACLLYLDPDTNPQVPERHFLAPIIKKIGRVRLAKLFPNDVKALAKELYPKAKPQTWNRQVVKPVRAVINFAHGSGLCAPIYITGFKEKDKRVRRAIDRTWIDAFMKTAIEDGNPRLAAYALFMFTTAARPIEAIRLCPHHFDLDNKRAFLSMTKNGDGRDFMLTGEMVEVLRSLEPRTIERGKFKGEVRVFGWADTKGPLKPWKSVCKRAGIAVVQPYEGGRHSFATEAVVRQERNIVTSARVGNWKDPSVLLRNYAHAENLDGFAEDVFGADAGTKLTQGAGGKSGESKT